MAYITETELREFVAAWPHLTGVDQTTAWFNTANAMGEAKMHLRLSRFYSLPLDTQTSVGIQQLKMLSCYSTLIAALEMAMLRLIEQERMPLLEGFERLLNDIAPAQGWPSVFIDGATRLQTSSMTIVEPMVLAEIN